MMLVEPLILLPEGYILSARTDHSTLYTRTISPLMSGKKSLFFLHSSADVVPESFAPKDTM